MRVIRHWPRPDGSLNEHSQDLGPRAVVYVQRGWQHLGMRAGSDMVPIVKLRPHEQEELRRHG